MNYLQFVSDSEQRACSSELLDFIVKHVVGVFRFKYNHNASKIVRKKFTIFIKEVILLIHGWLNYTFNV